MKKCDLCPHSYLEKDKLVCPFGLCLLKHKDWEEILKVLRKKAKGE